MLVVIVAVVGTTVIMTVDTAAAATPSLLVSVSVVDIAPLDVKTRPLSAALTFATVPLNMTVAVLLPLTPLSPAVVASVSVPAPTLTVIASDESGSATLIALPPPIENVSGLPALTICVPGTVLTGGSLTAATLIARVTLLLS